MQQFDIADVHEIFPTLLKEVEGGSEVLLTKDGRPIARVIPESESSKPSELTPEQQARAHEAIEGIRALRDRLNLGPFDMEQFKRDRDEGRM